MRQRVCAQKDCKTEKAGCAMRKRAKEDAPPRRCLRPSPARPAPRPPRCRAPRPRAPTPPGRRRTASAWPEQHIHTSQRKMSQLTRKRIAKTRKHAAQGMRARAPSRRIPRRCPWRWPPSPRRCRSWHPWHPLPAQRKKRKGGRKNRSVRGAHAAGVSARWCACVACGAARRAIRGAAAGRRRAGSRKGEREKQKGGCRKRERPPRRPWTKNNFPSTPPVAAPSRVV